MINTCTIRIMPYALVIRDLPYALVISFCNHLVVTLDKFVTKFKSWPIDLKFPMVATRFFHSRTSAGK